MEEAISLFSQPPRWGRLLAHGMLSHFRRGCRERRNRACLPIARRPASPVWAVFAWTRLTALPAARHTGAGEAHFHSARRGRSRTPVARAVCCCKAQRHANRRQPARSAQVQHHAESGVAAILGFRCTGHNALHLRQLNGALLKSVSLERVRRIQRQVVH